MGTREKGLRRPKNQGWLLVQDRRRLGMRGRRPKEGRCGRDRARRRGKWPRVNELWRGLVREPHLCYHATTAYSHRRAGNDECPYACVTSHESLGARRLRHNDTFAAAQRQGREWHICHLVDATFAQRRRTFWGAIRYPGASEPMKMTA